MEKEISQEHLENSQSTQSLTKIFSTVMSVFMKKSPSTKSEQSSNKATSSKGKEPAVSPDSQHKQNGINKTVN